MNTLLDVRRTLRDWITTNAGIERGNTRFDDQTLLFADGLLQSIQAMELILLVETLRGVSFTVDELKPAAFASIDAIVARFFAHLTAEHTT